MKTHIHPSSLAAAAALLVAAGCTVGPDYKPPVTDTPELYRTADPAAAASSATNSFADLGWWDVYEDPQLKSLITEALTNSWDVKIAASRVLQAEAQAGITRSQKYPGAYAGGAITDARGSERGKTKVTKGMDTHVRYGDLFVFAPSYEIDFWGRIRRANEAALARLLAATESQRLVRQTLVAQVATAYFELLEYDQEMQIGQSSYINRTNSLDLTQTRESGGVASLQDVYQSKMLVAAAESSIVNAQRLIGQTENALNILLGRNPGPVGRGAPLKEQKVCDLVPPGLPSSLIARRPDIRAAEQNLVAANADIGQAKAAFYPQVTLTGTFGYQTKSFSDLFSSPASTWQFGPSVQTPLFTAGRLRNELKLARSRFEEALATYKKTVQNAFGEVSDALIAYQRSREFFAKQLAFTQANRDAAALANVRYLGGVTSYLEVLYNEQQLFDAELMLAQARRNELQSVVQLYSALGGGWRLADVQQARQEPAADAR